MEKSIYEEIITPEVDIINGGVGEFNFDMSRFEDVKYDPKTKELKVFASMLGANPFNEDVVEWLRRQMGPMTDAVLDECYEVINRNLVASMIARAIKK